MVIIKICILHYYFQLHFLAQSFGAIFMLNSIFFKKAMHTIVSTITDCEISHYIFKILQN
jgi:hypothetical protein